MKVSTQIRFVGKSDVGQQRTNNEDSLIVLENDNVCAVADGMGGHLGGEVASHMVIEAIREEFENQSGSFNGDLEAVRQRLVSVIEDANRAINSRGNRDHKLRNMGTTVVASIYLGSSMVYAFVGDSRIYRLRQGELSQISEDHSWVGELRKRNLISVEDARRHPLRNIITRALGMDADVEVDAGILETEPGDIFLFCSDGLTDLVADDEMEHVLTHCGGDIEGTVDTLITMANDAGGNDNVTVILCRIDAL